eukprot:GHVU01204802.1.p2 GENE.GHVU01204802.1~~GHVU01204802.1.p2  ORF type:complete len:118 (+),score=17.61 GHVU01204802.1:545-898(+)
MTVQRLLKRYQSSQQQHVAAEANDTVRSQQSLPCLKHVAIAFLGLRVIHTAMQLQSRLNEDTVSPLQLMLLEMLTSALEDMSTMWLRVPPNVCAELIAHVSCMCRGEVSSSSIAREA